MRRKKWTTEEELEIWAKGIKTFPPPKEGKKYGPSDAFKPLFINNWKNRLRYSTESTPKYYRSHHHRFSGDLLSGGAGSGKCLGKGTKVMLFNGTTKNVEDIQVGEYLMGPDSLPRRVESTCTGQEEMFLIKPSRKEGFVCNRSHILSLRDSDENIINISVDAFLKLPVKKQQSLKLWEPKTLYISGSLVKNIHVPTKDYHDAYYTHEFTAISKGMGDYYGFTLSGTDKLFLLGDFTVTHNTTTANAIGLEYAFKYWGSRGLVGAKTFGDVKSIIIESKWGYRDLLSIKDAWDHPAVISYPTDHRKVLILQPYKNAPKHHWSEIEFFHFDDWERVRGRNIDWARFEEMSQVKIADIIDELPRRMRSDIMPCSHCIATTNPPESLTHWSISKWNVDQHLDNYEGEPGFIGQPCNCQFCQVCLGFELGEYPYDDDGFCTNPKCPDIKDTGLPAKRDEYEIDGIKTFCPGNQYYWRLMFSSALDNPHVRPDFLQTLKGSSDSRIFQLYAMGKPTELNANNVFSAFSQLNVRDQNKPVDYEKDLFWSFDFNNRPQCSVILQEEYNEDGTLNYIDQLDEIILFDIKEMLERVDRERGASPEHVALEFMNRYPDFKNTIYMYGDPTAINKTSGPLEVTKYQIIYNMLTEKGYKVVMMVRKTKDKRMIPIIDRVNNANIIFKDHLNTMRFFINPQCKYTIMSVKDLKWDKTGENTDKKLIDENARRTTKVILPEDVYKTVLFVSHPADALTYYFYQRFPLIKTEKALFFTVPGDSTVIMGSDGTMIRRDQVKDTLITEHKESILETLQRTLNVSDISHQEDEKYISDFSTYFF